MKNLFINQVKSSSSYLEKIVTLYGWVGAIRDHGGVAFVDLYDSTGFIQLVLDKKKISSAEMSLLTLETAIKVEGIVVDGKNGSELSAEKMSIISRATGQISPHLRDDIDIFDPANANHLLNNRHLYIRNPKVIAMLKFRHTLMGFVHQWFREQGFIEITAPILTPIPLYDDSTAIDITLHDEHLFLTQCVGFYLESAVHAFEKVYNIGPSFRREESRSKRHLMEYWHIKAEFTFAELEDVISCVESLISAVTAGLSETILETSVMLKTQPNLDGTAVPFPRITYREAVQKLQTAGYNMQFGRSLGTEEEEYLSKLYPSPFWVVGIPRSIEPFPYVINPDDTEVTMTADLIASRGYGELLGVAEKISDLEMLEIRMKEKGRDTDKRYDWSRELREYGTVSHVGFGLGVERYIRWLLGFPHVRDAIPFPRVFGRRVFP